MAREAAPPARGDDGVAAREDPRRGALEEVEVAHLGLDLGHELDRRGAGADDRDAAAGQIVFVVPARGVKHRARERVQAREVGDRRIGQRADRRDEHLGGEVAARGPDLPALGVLVPAGLEHLVPVAHVPGDVVAAGDVVDVGLDLGLVGEGAGPSRVLLVRVGVQDAGDVARAAGIAVVTPGAAQVVGPFEHDEVLDPVPAQGDRHAQAREAGAGDRDLHVTGVVLGHLVSWTWRRCCVPRYVAVPLWYVNIPPAPRTRTRARTSHDIAPGTGATQA